ncbi:pyruvate:ferredoxin (flavodoxin) oxidoreductase [Mediterraneibacter agrestimuris]|uniref:pyruvate:ferredoxin (flavodoxin) oxidoreductase n=1 Tax=Mediterraneibacter agrestimuris TaxID=2941333 RepID=UPI00203F4D5D|nr:pyruvate:ferredoxin (flavodoxin) oxidoreductase [Mediterraneibacter agrestimuris]
MARKMKTMDGNQAAAHVSYAYTEVAAIYPITPSSVMPEHVDEWATEGRENIFGTTVEVTEMQSEAGAAGAVHGSLSAGALTTTFTASQGLLLMIPNLYKVAGEQLPGVFNVSARAIASHALSIFGDHSDVYACRQTGAAMLCESSVQEVMDLTAVAHCAALEGKIPFINFFDGFRTSHEIQKIETWDYEDLKDLVNMDAIDAFRAHALNPNHPCQRGSAQNPDIFFQAREACNPYYDALPGIVQNYMDKVNAKIGTDYKLFNYYGAEDAERVIIAMGSACETIEETVDYMMAAGEKVGVVKVRLYRPFCAQALIDAIPETVKTITVLDRTKEPGALGEPLYLDVVAALKGTKFDAVPVLSGRYGLGSKDTTPAQIVAVFNNTEKKMFTIGIVDDVTNLSLEVGAPLVTTPEGTINCKFWGLGADGTVGANKNSIKIIGDNTDMYAQAYFDYDSKKSGGVTMSHLRFGKSPIKSTYLIRQANFVACHNPSYVDKYNMVQELVDGGTFLLNCPWDMEGLEKHLPGQVKAFIANHGIKFYTIDGIKIGKEIGLGGRINTVLQSAFFKLAAIIPEEEAIDLMKKAAKATYGRKGDKIVQMNYDAIDAGAKQVVEVAVPESWKDAADEGLFAPEVKGGRADVVDFVKNVQVKVNAQEGNTLPVSAFNDYVDGSTPSGSSAYEKRGIAVDIPVWKPENCIQCNRCAYVCPHAVIRPVALTEEEAAKAPEGLQTLDMTGMPGMKFTMTVSAYDCTGCGSCANVCPGKKGEKALVMENMEANAGSQKFFDFGTEIPVKPEVVSKFKEATVKGSQFKQPLLEFSGACAGCGETPYAKLITQLFGDRMYIANATGCSSIWGNSSPSTPYTVNAKGQGPAWSNSLFEDNAEFGYGMLLAQNTIRARLKKYVEKIAEVAEKEDVKATALEYLDTFACGATNGTATDKLVAALEACDCDMAERLEVLKNKDFLAKKSQWIFGGDGWAYDIGFGGVDHVLASGKDINIMVFDTEVYSNTGGQSSKATKTGATAQFAAGGKETKKKDLAGIAMSYGYVYVAQIAMGADFNQTVKAIAEAEAYPGPSLIIAYAPCINHGIKKGMSKAQTEEQLAVECGYWNNFRYNPAAEGNKFSLDSKEPKLEGYQEFLDGEVRYNALKRANPEKAAKLFAINENEAKERYDYLKKLIAVYAAEEE